MFYKNRLKKLEKKIKGKTKDTYRTTIDGETYDLTLDEVFDICADYLLTEAHEISVSGGGSGDGHLAELLDGLTETEDF